MFYYYYVCHAILWSPFFRSLKYFYSVYCILLHHQRAPNSTWRLLFSCYWSAVPNQPKIIESDSLSRLLPPWAMRRIQRAVISSWVLMIWATAAVIRTVMSPVRRAAANRNRPDLPTRRAANEPPNRCRNRTICSDPSANPRSSITRWIKSSTGTEEPSKRQKRSVWHSRSIHMTLKMFLLRYLII